MYKRHVSLMNERVFPRESLDKPVENPNLEIAIPISPVPQSNEEIVEYVISDLERNMGK